MAYKLNNITDKVKNLLNGVPQNLNQVGRSIMDNKGFYQQGRLTAQPIQQAINNRVIKPAVNRLQQSPTLAKIQESIPNPINKISEGFSEASSMGLVDVPFRPSQNNIEKASYVTGSVLGYVNPLNPINKLGVFNKLDKFGKVALNPATSRIANPFLRKGSQALAGELAQSGAYIGAKKLSEAKGLSSKSNNNLATDVAFGLGMRGIGNIVPKGTIRVKGSIGNRPNNINPEDLGVSDRIKDFFRSVNKDTNPQSIRDAKNIIDDLAGKYLTKEEIDRVVEKARTTKSNDKFYEYLNDAIRNKFNNADASYSYADNLALGIKGEGPQSTGQILKDMKIGQTLEPEIPAGKVKQTFRTDKFNINEETQQVLKDLQNNLGLNARDVQSFDDMKSLASELGTSPQNLIKDIENNRITAGEVVALGDTISTSSQRILELTEKLKANPSDISIKNALDAEESFINQAIKKRIKGGTEAGRAVVAYKILANKTLDPTFWLERAQRKLGDSKNLTPEQIGVINDLITNKDRLGLATFIARLGESSFAEKVTTLWKAGLLTGFRTQEANIISNAAFGTLETIKDIPATAFDMGRSAITGKPRTKAFTPQGVASQGKGLVIGTKKGIEYIKNGIDPWDADKAEIFTPTRYGETAGGKLAQAYTDLVFRSLGATDRPFREAAFNRSLSEQAVLKGMNEKMTVEQINEILKNPTQDMLEAAKQDALYATFNKENKLSDAIKAGKAAGGTAVRTATDVVAPFTRTPTNVAEALFDYTPAGIIKDTVKKIINKESVTDKRLAESFGRSVTGTAIMWAGYELAKAGLMSGSRPSSEAERSQRDLEGKIDNAILVNGKWRSLGRVSPIGNLLLLGAAAYKNGVNVAATATEGVKSLTEQTFLKGVSSGLKAITEPERFASSFVDNALAGFVPSLVNDIARGTDTVVRDVDGLRQRIKSRIPGTRQMLPPKPNALGENTPQEGGVLGSMFDPFNSRTPTEDPIVKEMTRVGYNLNVIGDTLNDQKLTQAEKIEYQRIAGKYIKEFVPQVINAQGYKDLDKEVQKSIIEKTVNKAKDVAREEIKPRLGTIQSEEKSIFPQVGAAEQALPATETKQLDNVFTSDTKSKVKLVNKDVNVSTKKEEDKKATAMYVYTDPDTLTTQTLNLTKVLNLPEKTTADKLKKENESYKIVDKALSSALSEDQKQQIIKDLKLDREEVKYYLNAKESNEIKYAMILDRAQTYKDRESMLNDLITWRRSVNGQVFATDAVLDSLYEAELISKEERKALKDIGYDKLTGKIKVKDTASGGRKGTKLVLPKVSPVKLSPITLSNIKIPQIRKQNTKLNLTLPKKSRTMRIKV